MNNTSPVTAPSPVTLRDLVAQRVEARWEDWARAHPHLAAALDRALIIDAAVARLRDDPQFAAAMRQADLDEARLAALVQAVARLEQWVTQALAAAAAV